MMTIRLPRSVTCCASHENATVLPKAHGACISTERCLRNASRQRPIRSDWSGRSVSMNECGYCYTALRHNSPVLLLACWLGRLRTAASVAVLEKRCRRHATPLAIGYRICRATRLFHVPFKSVLAGFEPALWYFSAGEFLASPLFRTIISELHWIPVQDSRFPPRRSTDFKVPVPFRGTY